jgi:branched-chain amino acid transport system permease protein
MCGLVTRQVDPSYSAITINISLLTLAVVGGMRSKIGPILGAVVVIILPQLLTSLHQFEPVLYGTILLGFLIFLPHGLAGLIERRPTKSPLVVDPIGGADNNTSALPSAKVQEAGHGR